MFEGDTRSWCMSGLIKVSGSQLIKMVPIFVVLTKQQTIINKCPF